MGVGLVHRVMLGGGAGVGVGVSTPRAAGSALPHPACSLWSPEAPGSRERTMLGLCEEGSASGPHSQLRIFLPLLSTTILCPSLLARGAPGLVPVENPFPSAPGSLAPPAALVAAQAPALHWALSARQSG